MDRTLEKIGIALPAADAPRGFVISIVAVVEPGASAAITLATTPFAIVFSFSPAAKQLYAAESPAQMAVFPADVNVGPSSTVRLLMLEDEY